MSSTNQPPADDRMARRGVYYQGPGMVPLANGMRVQLDADMRCWTDPDDPTTLIVGRVALNEQGITVLTTARQVYVVATAAR